MVLVKLVGTIVGGFTEITNGVDTYYTSMVVPAGKITTGYDALHADVAAKKIIVDTSLGNSKTDASTFSCSSNNPKAQLSQFKTDMQATKTAVQDYRTAIKNLIAGVAAAK